MVQATRQSSAVSSSRTAANPSIQIPSNVQENLGPPLTLEPNRLSSQKLEPYRENYLR